ncbi:MAG: hypothetical protein AAF623_11910 [Planctomycetota bacterium]
MILNLALTGSLERFKVTDLFLERRFFGERKTVNDIGEFLLQALDGNGRPIRLFADVPLGKRHVLNTTSDQ